MIICKSPFRVSLFGGGTDYEDFYKEHGSFIIGTSINKYVYFSLRYRSQILNGENIISYTKKEKIDDASKTANPLFKVILEKYKNKDKSIDLHYFSDIPARTGLGGSSSCCSCLVYAFHKINNSYIDKKNLAKISIDIERNILKEPGGIQDQIWASYGGTNIIEIHKNGNFSVKPIPISNEFKKELLDSMVLIYSNEQRKDHKSANHKSSESKKDILDISKNSYKYFLNEDIPNIGKNLYISWLAKKNLSNKIETEKSNEIIEDCRSLGAYGSKLLGSGGCGFILTIANKKDKKKIIEKYKNNVLNFSFDSEGTSSIYQAND